MNHDELVKLASEAFGSVPDEEPGSSVQSLIVKVRSVLHTGLRDTHIATAQGRRAPVTPVQPVEASDQFHTVARETNALMDWAEDCSGLQWLDACLVWLWRRLQYHVTVCVCPYRSPPSSQVHMCTIVSLRPRSALWLWRSRARHGLILTPSLLWWRRRCWVRQQCIRRCAHARPRAHTHTHTDNLRADTHTHTHTRIQEDIKDQLARKTQAIARTGQRLPQCIVCPFAGGWDKNSTVGKHAGSSLTMTVAMENLAESFMAFNTNYHDTGLFGVYGVTDRDRCEDFGFEIMHEMTRMCYDVKEDDVSRAKNQLKASLMFFQDSTHRK